MFSGSDLPILMVFGRLHLMGQYDIFDGVRD
jgi:hypothetical protein